MAPAYGRRRRGLPARAGNATDTVEIETRRCDFIFFGVLAVTIAVVELLLTQTTRQGKKRFVTSMVIAGVFGGVALTGIPETFMNTGTLSDGCTLQVTSAIDEASPTDTSAFDPFDTTAGDTITFTASTDAVLTDIEAGLGMYVGGVPITLWTADRSNSEGYSEWTGSEPVQKYLDELEDESGMQLRGTYHVFGYLHSDAGDCEVAGYLRVNAEGVLATPLIIALWAAGAVLMIIIISLVVSVRRSIREARAFAEGNAVPTATGAMQTGGSAAPEVEPIGAFTEPVAQTQAMPAAETEVLPTQEPTTASDGVGDEPTPGEPADGEEPRTP